MSMSIRAFVARKEAEDLLAVLTELIIDYGQMSINDVLKGLYESTQHLCYDKDDKMFEYVVNPTAEGNDNTGWVTADGVKFMVINNPSGYWIVLPEPRILAKHPTAIQEALDKGILQEMKPTLMERPPLLCNHDPNEKPLGYFIAYRDGLDKKAALEAALKEMTKEDHRKVHDEILAEEKEAIKETFEAPPQTRARLLKMRDDERAKKDDEFFVGLQKRMFGESLSTLEKYADIEGMKVGQGEKVLTEHGAMRESNAGRGRFDLIPYESMEALAIWSEQGAIKYGDRNWEKGLSVKDCINRMIRHALKAGSGMTDEDHLAAVMWNASAAITMMKRRPDCDDHVLVRKVGQPKATGADLQAVDEYHNAGLEVHQCSFCGHIKPTSEWFKEPIGRYIFIYTCKECGKSHEWVDKI